MMMHGPLLRALTAPLTLQWTGVIRYGSEATADGQPGGDTFAGLPRQPDGTSQGVGWRAQDFDAVRQDPDALQARLRQLLPAVHGGGPLHSTHDSGYGFDHLPAQPVLRGEAGSLGHSPSAGAMTYHRLDLGGHQVIVTQAQRSVIRRDGLRPPSLDEITACLERLPRPLAQGLRFVVLHAQSLPTASGRRAEAAAGHQTIHFFPTDAKALQQLQGTLLHESTHLLQDGLWGQDKAAGRARMAGWKDAMRRDAHPTTLYAGEHRDEDAVREDCAEMAVMYYALVGTPWEPYLRQAYPHRSAAFERLLADARAAQQPVSSGPA